MFLAAFGFFGAIVFLPQWFQVVRGMGATESGLNLLPLVFALIVGATVSGQIVGADRPLQGRSSSGAMVVLAVGLFLMTNLRANTDLPVLWLWMVVAGLGVGPSFALFAALVQNSVEPRQIGSATASLTFFQQIGGTIGLTIAGTFLADSLTKELPGRLARQRRPAAVRRPVQPQRRSGGAPRPHRHGRPRRSGSSTRLPAEAGPFVEPFIAQIVTVASTRRSRSRSRRRSGSASARRFSLPRSRCFSGIPSRWPTPTSSVRVSPRPWREARLVLAATRERAPAAERDGLAQALGS